MMVVVGLSHRTTPIAVRERLALAGDRLHEAVSRIQATDPVGETMVLSTCNRVEIYAVRSTADTDNEELSRLIRDALSDIGGAEVVQHLHTAMDRQAVRHLFRVAASLDSLVVGEPHILGQFKEAVRVAEQEHALGPTLHAAVRCALHVAKRVRTETGIGTGHASVPTVAVTLAKQIFDDLAKRRALLVGAGEMAETAARLLARDGAKLAVVNRSAERAERLAKQVGGRPRPWSELEAALVQADIVITSTASERHVITREQLRAVRRARRGRSLFLIDIAVPRDVDPSVHDLDNVYLYDIDDLNQVVSQTLGDRAAEAERAEAIVKAEAVQFEVRHAQRAMDPVIVGLRSRTRELLDAELGRSLKGKLKHLSDGDRAALEVMLDAAVNRLLHEPTTRLKALANRPVGQVYAQTLSRLFALDEDIKPLPHGGPDSRDDERDHDDAAES